MEVFETPNNVRMSLLFNTYKGLLTDKQSRIMELHCDCDCSLAEIAEQVNISRQGVRDTIVTVEKLLTEFENALSLCEHRLKKETFLNLLEEALRNADTERAEKLLAEYRKTEKL